MVQILKDFTHSEIEKLVNDFDSENNAVSDLKSENYIDIPLNCPIDESSNTIKNDENTERILEMKVAGEQYWLNIQGFTRNHGLKIDMKGQDAHDILKVLFSKKVLELVCIETNRCEKQVLELGRRHIHENIKQLKFISTG